LLKLEKKDWKFILPKTLKLIQTKGSKRFYTVQYSNRKLRPLQQSKSLIVDIWILKRFFCMEMYRIWLWRERSKSY
jgi:hypothetical protein